MLKNKVFSAIVCFDVLCIIITAVFSQTEGAETLFITFLTVSYHFTMRLIVGESVTVICKNRSFKKLKISRLEERLFKALKVKRWKRFIITAKPEQFDMKRNSTEALLHNMAQAELVHKINAQISFFMMFLHTMRLLFSCILPIFHFSRTKFKKITNMFI